MKKRSISKLDLKKGTISSLENINGGVETPIRAAQSAENTTCMSLSACDTF